MCLDLIPGAFERAFASRQAIDHIVDAIARKTERRGGMSTPKPSLEDSYSHWYNPFTREYRPVPMEEVLKRDIQALHDSILGIDTKPQTKSKSGAADALVRKLNEIKQQKPTREVKAKKQDIVQDNVKTESQNTKPAPLPSKPEAKDLTPAAKSNPASLAKESAASKPDAPAQTPTLAPSKAPAKAPAKAPTKAPTKAPAKASALVPSQPPSNGATTAAQAKAHPTTKPKAAPSDASSKAAPSKSAPSKSAPPKAATSKSVPSKSVPPKVPQTKAPSKPKPNAQVAKPSVQATKLGTSQEAKSEGSGENAQQQGPRDEL